MDWLNNIAPTLIGLIGAGIGWFLKSKFEAKKQAEEALRNERAKIYIDILMPFVELFSDLSHENQQATLKKIISLEYRKKSFQLMLAGSDEVVKAWNNMWSTVYGAEKGQKEPINILLGFSDVLLAIRKSLGNIQTSLDNRDMLRWLIKDIDTFDKK
jgi:hypothetical protein